MIPKKTKNVQNNMSGQFETKQFQVLVSEKTFSVLFDTLYQDKIQSVMRELFSNAMDSHVQAGCPNLAFDVTLPTTLSPTFKIRDFGVSLTHEDVMGVYSDVFGTTKSETNDQVGYLGLGSKSPFAYTDAFTVRAFKDGIVRTYLVAFNNERIPEVSKIAEDNTTEPEGLEVSFPVKSHDVRDFAKKAAVVSVPLPVTPKFNKEVDITVPKPELELENGRIKFFENHRGYAWDNSATLPTIAIKQGWVTYPVQTGSVDNTDWLPYGKAVQIEVPIGTVDVAASRESLSMNDATKKETAKVLAEARDAVIAYVEKEIAASKNYYDACTKYFGSLSNMFNHNTVKTVKVRYQGKTLEQNIYLPTISGKWRNDRHSKWPQIDVHHGNSGPKIYAAKVPDTTFYYKLIDEKLPRMIMRLNDFAERNAVLMMDVTQADVDHVATEMGLDKKTFVNVTSLPDYPQQPKVKGKSLGVTTKPYTSNWKREDLPSDDDYYWLPVTSKNGKISVQTYNWEGGYKLFHDTILDTLNKASMAIKARGGPEFKGLTISRLSDFYVNIPKLYFMTKSVEKKIEPEEDKRLDIVIEKYIKDNEKYFKEARIAEYLNAQTTQKVNSELFGYNSCRDASHYWQYSSLVEKYVKVPEIPSEAKEIEQQFPLLFRSVTERHVQDYIKNVRKGIQKKEKANA